MERQLGGRRWWIGCVKYAELSDPQASGLTAG